MRILLFLLLLSPVFASAQILRAYGVIEVGSLPTSSATGPKFAYRPADSSFYRWVSGSTWVKIIPDEPDTLYLKQLSGTTALVDGDTIDISTYFLKSDTTSAFASYLKRPVGWGLSLLTGKYPFVDSSKVASRYYVSTNYLPILGGTLTGTGGNGFLGLPAQSGTPSTPASGFRLFANGAHNLGILDRNGWITTFDISATANRDFTYPSTGGTFALGTGTADRSARWSATNTLAAGNITDNGTKLEALLPWQFQSWTTAGRPTGVNGYTGFNTSFNWLDIYSSSGWLSPARAATTGGSFTAGYIPFGGTGGLTENANLRFTANTTLELPYGSFSTPAIEFGDAQKLYADYFGIKSVGSFGFYHYNHSNQLIGAFAVGVNLLNIGQNISGLRFGDNYIGYTANKTTALLNTSSGFEFFPGINTSGVGYTGTFKIRPNGDVYITSLPWVHPSAPNQATGALFELASTTKGFLMPKHTAAQRAAISSPITGLEVYQTDGTEGSYVKYASGWKRHLVEGDAATTWLKTELEAGRDVDITGGASTDLRFRGNTRVQVDGKFKIGSDSSFIHDPTQDTTFYKGNVKQLGNLYTQSGTNAGRNFPNVLRFKSDAAYSVAGTSYRNPGTGQFNWYILNDQRNFGEDGFGIKNENLQSAFGPTSYTTLFTIRNNGNLELGYSYQSRYTRVNSDTFMVSPTYNVSPETVINAAPFYVVGHSAYRKVVVQSKFYIGTDSTLKFDPSNDLLQLSAYGTAATTAAALSKTLTNYGVGFATDGTVTSREIKRDTTIYIDDADYDFSAAITTAQIASRFNRVIFWMTTTAAAGSDSELTLHTPDANLLQVEYLIHSVDEPAGFDNKIVFGSNNAVDSTNGLVSSYFPAAGQGVGIRAGLRSSVYKYRYY